MSDIVEWKPVIGWESEYLVSSDGQVKTVSGRICGQWNRDGYMRIRLRNPRALIKVHRLVAMAHVPNPNPDEFGVVNHIDNDPSNNKSSNLEWCTQKHNLQHMHRSGRARKLETYRKGFLNPTCRITAQDASRMVRLRSEGMPYAKIGLAVGFSKKTVIRVVSNPENYPLPPPPERGDGQ